MRLVAFIIVSVMKVECAKCSVPVLGVSHVRYIRAPLVKDSLFALFLFFFLLLAACSVRLLRWREV